MTSHTFQKLARGRYPRENSQPRERERPSARRPRSGDLCVCVLGAEALPAVSLETAGWQGRRGHLPRSASVRRCQGRGLPSAPARAHRPSRERGPDGGRGDAPLPWQPGPGCLGSRCRGLPHLLVRAKKEEERRAPPAIAVTSAAAAHRQEGL